MVSPCFLACKHFYGTTQSGQLERHPWNFRVFCARTKGAWVQFATWVISTTQIPFFCAAKGILWALWVLEDLQTDNSVETPLKNITLLEQPQGWDQGFEKGPFSRFPSALHPEQSLPDNTEVSFFLWIKLPLQEKYANAIHGSLVWGYSHPAIFSCLAHPADHPPPDMETSLLIQHPSWFWQSAPWACHCLEKGLV